MSQKLTLYFYILSYYYIKCLRSMKNSDPSGLFQEQQEIKLLSQLIDECLLAQSSNCKEEGAQEGRYLNKLKLKELNFENKSQLIRFYFTNKNKLQLIMFQIKQEKWTDNQITSFCFNCQFVDFVLENIPLNTSKKAQMSEIKFWYRRLSLYIQKQLIKITKHNLKQSDIKNLQEIYNQSRKLMSYLKERSQQYTQYSQSILLLSKCIMTTNKYEKLTVITFGLSFISIFLVICLFQYINVVNSIIANINALTFQQKNKLLQVWSFYSIGVFAVNGFLITVTLFFAVKKLSVHIDFTYNKLYDFANENKQKERGKKQKENQLQKEKQKPKQKAKQRESFGKTKK